MNNNYTKELCHSQFQGDELYHHGILGMHWGIRRYQPYVSGKRVSGRKEIGLAAQLADLKREGQAATVQSAAKAALPHIRSARTRALGVMQTANRNTVQGQRDFNEAWDVYKRAGRAYSTARREARPIDVSSVKRPDYSDVYRRLQQGSFGQLNTNAVSTALRGFERLASSNPIKMYIPTVGGKHTEFMDRFMDCATIGKTFLYGTDLGSKDIVSSLSGSMWQPSLARSVTKGYTSQHTKRPGWIGDSNRPSYIDWRNAEHG